MRIQEVIFWNKDPAERNGSDPQLDLAPAPFSNDLAKLARAFTKHGRVKHLWYLDGLEGQPSEPGPSETEAELIPRGMPGPIAASWQAEPVETERPIGHYRKVPFRQYRT